MNKLNKLEKEVVKIFLEKQGVKCIDDNLNSIKFISRNIDNIGFFTVFSFNNISFKNKFIFKDIVGTVNNDDISFILYIENSVISIEGVMGIKEFPKDIKEFKVYYKKIESIL